VSDYFTLLYFTQCQSGFLSWLIGVIAIAINYKSIKQNYYRLNGISGKDLRKRNVLRCRRKNGKDGDDCTSGGREFRVMAAATGKDRRPTVDSRKDGTYSWYDVAVEVGDGREGRRHEPTGLNMVAAVFLLCF